jgi:4-hydroxyphenylpyruvate dioxygenase
MKAAGVFEFMPPPPRTYYSNVRRRLGGKLSLARFAELEEMGILADRSVTPRCFAPITCSTAV